MLVSKLLHAGVNGMYWVKINIMTVVITEQSVECQHHYPAGLNGENRCIYWVKIIGTL